MKEVGMPLTRIVFVLFAIVTEIRCDGLRRYYCNAADSVVIGNRGIISHSTNEIVECRWNIKIPHPGVLTLTVKDLNISQANDGACDSSLEIGVRGGEKVYKLCSNEPEQTTYNFSSTEAKQVEIIFISKANTSTQPATFTLSYALDCDRQISGQEGQFTSPNYPNKYFDGLTCTYYFEQPTGTLVELYFVEINVKSDDTQCLQDYIGVARGTGSTTERFCNKKLPRGKILIDPNKDAVKFVSSDTNGWGDGFAANWTTVSTSTAPTTKKPDEPEDLAWIALVSFAVLTVGVIIFVVARAKMNRSNIPPTPDSQYSNTIFKFDSEHMERQPSFRTVGSDTSSLRSSVRGRISKKWNINDSVVAKKRAFKRQHNDVNHASSTRTQSLSRMAALRQTSLDDTGMCVAANQFSPPPRYDSFFRQYSTRRARVPQSQYLPRTSEYNTVFGEFESSDSLDDRGCKYNGDSGRKRAASARENRQMWRSTDSIPDRWRITSPTATVKAGVEHQPRSGGIRSPVVILLNNKNETLNERGYQIYEQIENNVRGASRDMRRTISAPTKTESSSKQMSRHGSADDILRKISENSIEEYRELKRLENKTTAVPIADEHARKRTGEETAHENPGHSEN